MKQQQTTYNQRDLVNQTGKALEAGTVKLAGTNKSAIIRETSALIREPDIYEAMSKANNPYGYGQACE